jgi:hypothetical protein
VTASSERPAHSCDVVGGGWTVSMRVMGETTRWEIATQSRVEWKRRKSRGEIGALSDETSVLFDVAVNDCYLHMLHSS